MAANRTAPALEAEPPRGAPDFARPFLAACAAGAAASDALRVSRHPPKSVRLDFLITHDDD